MFERTLLAKFLKTADEGLHRSVMELRDSVKLWLDYIPATFPHYTSHSIDHSEAIIAQVSNLIFTEDAAHPIVPLSAMEAYIVCAAAFLHDAGMFTSDEVKVDILGSASWRDWITTGGGAKRWTEIENLRTSGNQADAKQRFIVDRQLRFLIAEFIRRTHHLRVKEVVAENLTLFGLTSTNPLLVKTIVDVCLSHGFSQHELTDPATYPDRRDIANYKVNVRFIAILLRIGDLLDMTADRACPLLLNAACPLPAESYAHWSQYSRITHMLVAPDKIEISAECSNQLEHRLLVDWCTWLVSEVEKAQVVMAQSARHKDWRLPHVSIGTEHSSIRIVPAATATYIPSNWRMEMDPEMILSRLIKDVYTSRYSFLRELLQNAFDATRCALYREAGKHLNTTLPISPTLLPPDLRERYPIRVTLENRAVRNDLSGEDEEQQVLRVEDGGMGMDQNVIRAYLLQIGRSFYTTPEFNREFRLVLARISVSDFYRALP